MKGRDHMGYLDIDGRIILKYILMDVDDIAQMHYGLSCCIVPPLYTYLAHDKANCVPVMVTVIWNPIIYKGLKNSSQTEQLLAS
jgi:hypothetical protein